MISQLVWLTLYPYPTIPPSPPFPPSLPPSPPPSVEPRVWELVWKMRMRLSDSKGDYSTRSSFWFPFPSPPFPHARSLYRCYPPRGRPGPLRKQCLRHQPIPVPCSLVSLFSPFPSLPHRTKSLHSRSIFSRQNTSRSIAGENERQRQKGHRIWVCYWRMDWGGRGNQYGDNWRWSSNRYSC